MVCNNAITLISVPRLKSLLLILLIIWKGVCQLWQYLPFYSFYFHFDQNFISKWKKKIIHSPDHLPRCVPALPIYTFHYCILTVNFTKTLYRNEPLATCQGVCHGDELALLYLPLALTSSGDRQMSRIMVDWWSNFAKHGWDQGQRNFLGETRGNKIFLGGTRGNKIFLGKDGFNQNSRIRVALQSFHSRNPTPESKLWQEWGENEQYLRIGEGTIFSLFNSSFQTTVLKWTFPTRWGPEWISGRAFVVWRAADMEVASIEDDLLLDSCKQFKFISNRRSVFFGILD